MAVMERKDNSWIQGTVEAEYLIFVPGRKCIVVMRKERGHNVFQWPLQGNE